MATKVFSCGTQHTHNEPVQLVDFDHYWFITVVQKLWPKYHHSGDAIVNKWCGRPELFISQLISVFFYSRVFKHASINSSSVLKHFSVFSQSKCSVKPSHPVALSGLQAAPLAVLPKASLSLSDGLQQDATHPDVYETAADGFRQGTEPSRRLLVDLNTGLVKEHIGDMNRRGMSVIPLYEVLFIWPIVSSYWHIFARCKVWSLFLFASKLSFAQVMEKQWWNSG